MSFILNKLLGNSSPVYGDSWPLGLLGAANGQWGSWHKVSTRLTSQISSVCCLVKFEPCTLLDRLKCLLGYFVVSWFEVSPAYFLRSWFFKLHITSAYLSLISMYCKRWLIIFFRSAIGITFEFFCQLIYFYHHEHQ